MRLNHTFGDGFVLVGGADADILMDDSIIDVKTVKDPKVTLKILQSDHWLLYTAEDRRIKGLDSSKQIAKISLYFSR